MGDYESGNVLARDGNSIISDPNDFGKEWQVLSTEPMLFHNVEGVQHPEACAMPTLDQASRRLGESKFSRKEAEEACSQVAANEREDCVYDVMATGDLEMAGAY